MSKLKRFGIAMEETLLDKLDRIVVKKGYANRSEAIRNFTREHLVEEEWEAKDREVVGTVTLIYSHEAHELADKLTDFQHSHYKNIISTTHIHLDKHNCLEVLVVKGKSQKVKEIADRLISTKGVMHGKLVMTTTGKELT